MLVLYHLLIAIVAFVLHGIALFNKKIRLFIDGRKDVFTNLSKTITANDKVVWVHAASLGEFEQGLPIIQQLKKERPTHKILLTFFSPSGYEVKKNSNAADIITYLPLDTQKNAAKFIRLATPEIAIFIKYEFWPNYLTALKKANVPTFLVSGIFREKQVFFKPYGAFMRKKLAVFTHFFVQDIHSEKLLHRIGFTNTTISGDTRFDRVSEIVMQDNTLTFIEDFLQGNPCVVIGSSWPEDEALFIPFINDYQGAAKFIIAPHRIEASAISALKNSLLKKTVLFSEKTIEPLSKYEVFIVDTVGWLTKIYSYASLAYVGGGMGKTGLHNILEPAVFGIPVVIGKNFNTFNEAVALTRLGGVISIHNKETLYKIFYRFLTDKNDSEQIGAINSNYIAHHRGATEKVMVRLLKSIAAQNPC